MWDDLYQIEDGLDVGSGNLFRLSPFATSSSFLSYDLECYCWDLLSNQIAMSR